MSKRLLRLATGAVAVMGGIGCSHFTTFVGPNGEQMAQVRCRPDTNMPVCMERARDACGGGNFQVVEEHNRNGYVVLADRYGAAVMPTSHGDIIIACLPPGATPPAPGPAPAAPAPEAAPAPSAQPAPTPQATPAS